MLARSAAIILWPGLGTLEAVSMSVSVRFTDGWSCSFQGPSTTNTFFQSNNLNDGPSIASSSGWLDFLLRYQVWQALLCQRKHESSDQLVAFTRGPSLSLNDLPLNSNLFPTSFTATWDDPRTPNIEIPPSGPPRPQAAAPAQAAVPATTQTPSDLPPAYTPYSPPTATTSGADGSKSFPHAGWLAVLDVPSGRFFFVDKTKSPVFRTVSFDSFPFPYHRIQHLLPFLFSGTTHEPPKSRRLRQLRPRNHQPTPPTAPCRSSSVPSNLSPSSAPLTPALHTQMNSPTHRLPNRRRRNRVCWNNWLRLRWLGAVVDQERRPWIRGMLVLRRVR